MHRAGPPCGRHARDLRSVLQHCVLSANAWLAAALDRLAARLAGIQRKRSRVEAPPELTSAYTAFVFAAGFARLGERARAEELARAARGALEPVLADDVHALHAAAFAARIEQALARRPRHTPLPQPLIERLHALDRVARYKVDRLRESLPALEPEPVVDAIGAFARIESPPVIPPPELVALLAVDEPAARAAHIEEHLAKIAARTPGERAPLLAACLDAMLELAEEQVIPLLMHALPLLEGVPLSLHARAMTVAARFGWGELVPELVASLRARVASESAAALGPVLSPALRALRGLGLRDEMAALVAAAEPLLGPDRDRADLETERARKNEIQAASDEHRGLRLTRAGALAYLGDPRGQALLNDAHAAVDKTTHPFRRLLLVRDLTRGYSHAAADLALEQITKLAGSFVHITDTFGTNSHYCVSVLHFIDSLVHGITDLADDSPHDRSVRRAAGPAGALAPG